MQSVSIKLGPVYVQMAIAMLALLLIAFAPPAYGRMMLIPLNGEPVGGLLIDSPEVTSLAPGPTPGSLLVEGDRRLVAGLWSKGILVLAAPVPLCASLESERTA
jgi:hypothetical protein